MSAFAGMTRHSRLSRSDGGLTQKRNVVPGPAGIQIGPHVRGLWTPAYQAVRKLGEILQTVAQSKNFGNFSILRGPRPRKSERNEAV
jgi:hypothetical protein